MQYFFAGRRIWLALSVATIAVSFAVVLSQRDRAVRVIVPQNTGSTADVVARALSPALSRAIGQLVTVDNMPDSGGVVGTEQLVRAPKDGTTLALISSNHAINPSIYKRMPFDSVKDIEPIMVFGTAPLVLVVPATLPVKNTHELIALAKSKPGKLSYGSTRNGGTLFLASELFKEQSGADLKRSAFRSITPLMTAITEGKVDMAFLSVSLAAPGLKNGKLRSIAVSTGKRSPTLPDVPTLAESGLPGYNFDVWLALIAPSGVPKETIDKLHENLVTALATREVQASLAAQGVTPFNAPPEQAEVFFRREIEKYAKLAQRSGTVPE
jgi:tripartite-type tricarboxylate transporter receptor subunit TctC